MIQLVKRKKLHQNTLKKKETQPELWNGLHELERWLLWEPSTGLTDANTFLFSHADIICKLPCPECICRIHKQWNETGLVLICCCCQSWSLSSNWDYGNFKSNGRSRIWITCLKLSSGRTRLQNTQYMVCRRSCLCSLWGAGTGAEHTFFPLSLFSCPFPSSLWEIATSCLPVIYLLLCSLFIVWVSLLHLFFSLKGNLCVWFISLETITLWSQGALIFLQLTQFIYFC